MTEPLRLSFGVACPPQRAFQLWAGETSRWWPASHSVSAAPGLTVTFEPRAGGRIFERSPAGVEHDWGEVLVWEPPHRLSYLWHLMFDRSDATQVDITFAAEGSGTTVTIVHHRWERLGSAAAERRERNRQGWAGLLGHFQEVCRQQRPA